MNKLSVSIVVYSSDLVLLEEVINSLQIACRFASEREPLKTELDLVNNNPGDAGNQALFDLAKSGRSPYLEIQVVESGHNGGYGAGNNISIKRHPDSDFHLVLNPDALLTDDALANGLAYLQSNLDVGLLTPQVRGLDGVMHYLCKRDPKLLDMVLRSIPVQWLRDLFSKRDRIYEMRDKDYTLEIKPVPYPTGCFMLFRRSILKTISGFDERYFLHYEDADVGRKVAQVSQTAYVPGVKIIHKWSRDSHKSWKMRWITIKSGLKYWIKWGGVY